MKKIICAGFVMALLSTSAQEMPVEDILESMKNKAKAGLMDKWYPLSVDKEDGGFYSEITYDFKLGAHHDKMVVSQARHVWATSKAFEFYKDSSYLDYAAHGFRFLKDVLWDEENGGFHTLVRKNGEPIFQEGQNKTAYGNAFAIYGLAAYYKASGNQSALSLAKETFHWLEEHSHDPVNKGYYQSMEIDGSPIMRNDGFPSTSDIGYKDQNSSIHLLEAFTELYQVWPDALLRERLEELLLLIRDTIVNKDHYMNLFFTEDWTPVSFQDESKETIAKHYYLDHVSFGHDVETAYLMLEASEALGRKDQSLTLEIGKAMVDHSLENGWDKKLGGFYDGGYYYKNEETIVIVNSDKNWWSQAEGLNTLLIIAAYYPNDKHNYKKHFRDLWDYMDGYLLDDKYGGWYEWGLDGRPETRKNLKGHVWKTTYHNFRAMLNCIEKLEKG